VSTEHGEVVVILGAGFSHAVFSKCPVTDTLGERVRDRLSKPDRAKLPEGAFREGRFEEWLSYLSEPQPHFTSDQSADAQALAVRVSRAICEVLSDVQYEALQAQPPGWFWRFLSVLHVLRADVISLNYDNFVECGVLSMRPRVDALVGGGIVIEDDILGGLPPCAEFPRHSEQSGRAFTYAGDLINTRHERRATFQLLKLHGSLSWYWLPEGGGGSTIRRWQLPGLFGQPWDDDQGLRRQELPAHEVFVVPPAALKSQRLREPVMKELWQRAAAALREATRVVLVGYSLPLADHSLSGMLSESLRGRAVDVEIADLDPEPVEQRLRRLGTAAKKVEQFAGPSPIAEWTDAQVRQMAAAEVDALRSDARLEGEVLIFPAGGRDERFRTVNCPEGATGPVVLELNPAGQQLVKPVMYDDLRPLLATASSCVIEDGQKRLPVIDHWVRSGNSGVPMDQLHLIPAGLGETATGTAQKSL